MPGVFQVYYVENVIESINHNITQIGLVIMGLVAILLLIVVLLINNTLRLALFSSRFSYPQHATRRCPSLVYSMALSVARIHARVALRDELLPGFLIALLSFATKRINELKLIQNNDRLLLLMGALLILGILVAVVSSYRAVNKYLKLSLDELY